MLKRRAATRTGWDAQDELTALAAEGFWLSTVTGRQQTFQHVGTIMTVTYRRANTGGQLSVKAVTVNGEALTPPDLRGQAADVLEGRR